MSTADRRYRAGESIEDYCRACKTDRMHTIVVTDADARPLRVSCGYCHSEHNYRGGPRLRSEEPERASSARPRSTEPERASSRQAPHSEREPFPIVSEREVAMSADSSLESMLRRV